MTPIADPMFYAFAVPAVIMVGLAKGGFGGPLSDDWMVKRRDLGVRILNRMRELGMTPALGAFAGHVPAAFASHTVRTPRPIG